MVFWTVSTLSQTKIRPEFFIVRGVIVINMMVGPDNMLIGPDSWKRGPWLGRVIQNIESLDFHWGIPQIHQSNANLSSGTWDQGGFLSPDGWVKSKTEGSNSWGPIRSKVA